MGGTGSGKNWSCSGEQGLASETLIQLSADWWGCSPSLVVFRPEATQPLGLGLYGQVNGELQEGLCQGDLSRVLPPVRLSLW